MIEDRGAENAELEIISREERKGRKEEMIIRLAFFARFARENPIPRFVTDPNRSCPCHDAAP